MYIRRNYSDPFFSNRRRKRGLLRGLVIYAALIFVFLWFVDSNFSRLQLVALEAVGQAPEPTPFASTFAQQGMESYAAGDYDAAAQFYQRAVAQQPQNVNYIYEYGRALLEVAVTDPSLFTRVDELGQQAIDADPRDPRGYALRTRALNLSGNSANAVPVGQAGLQVDPNFAPLHYALSSAYLSIDRYDVSLERAERAIELDPYDPTARRIYSYVLIWVARQREAMEQLERAIALQPNNAGPYFELAILYLNNNEPELAIATYEQVLAMQPENARAYLRLCEAYAFVGEVRRALGYCADSLGIDDRNAAAWATDGHVKFRNRNYEGAIDSFHTCLELGGDDIRCWYLRGLSHYYLGQCDDAWDVLGDARIRMGEVESGNPVYTSIMDGFTLITRNCSGFAGRTIPQSIAPTSIPPTPMS